MAEIQVIKESVEYGVWSPVMQYGRDSDPVRLRVGPPSAEVTECGSLAAARQLAGEVDGEVVYRQTFEIKW